MASTIARSPSSGISSLPAKHFEGDTIERSLGLIHCGVSSECFMYSRNLEYVCFGSKLMRKQRQTKAFKYVCPPGQPRKVDTFQCHAVYHSSLAES